jgi:hypothetical protein
LGGILHSAFFGFAVAWVRNLRQSPSLENREPLKMAPPRMALLKGQNSKARAQALGDEKQENSPALRGVSKSLSKARNSCIK